MTLRASPSSTPTESISDPAGAQASAQRPWLGINFVCAGAYQRVYRSADGTKYMARCPRCGKSINFKVGQGGSDQRFFDVSCR